MEGKEGELNPIVEMQERPIDPKSYIFPERIVLPNNVFVQSHIRKLLRIFEENLVSGPQWARIGNLADIAMLSLLLVEGSLSKEIIEDSFQSMCGDLVLDALRMAYMRADQIVRGKPKEQSVTEH